MAINEKEARFESRKEKVEFVRSVYDQDQAPQHLHLHLSLKIIKPLQYDGTYIHTCNH